jgi:tRNA threonylcarbamoyladenosine biosynthesis protein TsaE
VATCLTPGFRLYLSGDLGTGKTTLVRELLRALGHRGRVASPTYTLIEPYNLSRFDLHHFDFYRLTHPGAWRDAGFEDAFDSQIVVVVEWPEHAGDGLPAPDLHLGLSADPGEAEDARGLAATAFSNRGQACLTALLDAGFCATVPSPDWGCAAR